MRVSKMSQLLARKTLAKNGVGQYKKTHDMHVWLGFDV
jgi:hypothetical protein